LNCLYKVTSGSRLEIWLSLDKLSLKSLFGDETWLAALDDGRVMH